MRVGSGTGSLVVGFGDFVAVGDELVGSGPADCWFSSANTVPPSTMTSRAISAMSGQVHRLRFFFFFSSPSPSPSPSSSVDTWAVVGRMRVVPSSPVVSRRVASSPAMPPVAIAGTAIAAEFRSPRRRACAARATVAEDDGRSLGFLAIIAMTRFCTGIGTVGGSGGACSLICAIAIATCDSPVNGRLPARHS